MLRTTLLMMICVLLAAAGAGAATGEPAPVVSVPQVSQAPALDGEASPSQWRGAARLSDLVLAAGGGMPALGTEVYVQYDATSIYLGIICYDPQPEALRTEVSERDGPVWEDDSVELYIDTVGDRKDYAHLAVNAAGVRYDAWNQDATQDFRWTAATVVREDGWSAEIALPFAGGVGPEMGDTWIVNVARNAPRTGERSSWAAVNQRFGELSRMGTLIFAGAAVGVHLQSLGDLRVGRNTAQIQLSPLGRWSGVVAGKLNVRSQGATPADHFFHSQPVRVAGEPQLVNFPWLLPSDGPGTVLFSLTDEQGQALWRTAVFPLETTPVMPMVRQAEKALSEALVAYGAHPQGEAKDRLRSHLEETLEAWRALTDKLRERQTLTAEQYAALHVEASILHAAAQALVGTAPAPPGEG